LGASAAMDPRLSRDVPSASASASALSLTAELPLQPFDLPPILLLPLLEVLLVGHLQQRLGIGILGGLSPAVHLLGEQTPLSAVVTKFSCIQAGGL